MDEPNVLLLDEPTNDLDIETLTSLEDLLDGWAGTLLVVSHDRYLLERVCDRQVALLGDGRVRDLPGGVEEYLRLRHAVGRAVGGVRGGCRPRGSRGRAHRPRGAGAGDAAPSPAEAREARKMMARVEKQLARLAQREERLHAAMSASATDHEKVLGLNRELREVVDEREVLELEWLEAAEVVGPESAAPAGRRPLTRVTASGGRSSAARIEPCGPGAQASRSKGRSRRRSDRRGRRARRRQLGEQVVLVGEQVVQGGVDDCHAVGVSRTMTPRRSAGSGSRSTQPRVTSRSTRLVIVPLVTSVSATSCPGLSS